MVTGQERAKRIRAALSYYDRYPPLEHGRIAREARKLLPLGSAVYTEEEIKTVLGVLTSLQDALHEAGKTISHATRSSESVMWTGTDEFAQAFFDAVRILQGVGSPDAGTAGGPVAPASDR